MSSSTAGGMASSPRFSLACLCDDTLTAKALLASFWNNMKPPAGSWASPKKDPCNKSATVKASGKASGKLLGRALRILSRQNYPSGFFQPKKAFPLKRKLPTRGREPSSS
ncbi:hypothetical protein CGRA01v4_00087 [Colletotrichum graminicola]|nr:hypothetical protein CGRA01v4_00087 [Colletotrichum graminicola]